MFEFGVEKVCVVDLEFFDYCEERCYFSGIFWWNLNGFVVDEDIESVGIKDDLVIVVVYFFLIFLRVVVVDVFKVDYVGMWFGVIFDEGVFSGF